MAVDITRSIKINFDAVNRTSKAFDTVTRDLDRFTGKITDIVGPFATATKGIVAIDAALMAFAAGGIAYSTNQFASFDDTMRKVGSIMGATDEELIQMTDLTKELGSTTRYTAKEAGEGLEFLAMAGLSADESMKALPQTLMLAQASTTGLGQTADILTNIMSGYGVAVEDLNKTTDILTAGFTSSNTNLTELGNAFKYVGPVASSMGYELEETTAILGKLADAGIKGESGGTALRNILIALAAPAGNAGKMMKELGVNTEELGIDLASSANALKSLGVEVKDAEGNLKPFPDIMKQLQTGLEKIQDPADRTAILIEIFGARGGPQLAALLKQGADSVINLENKIRNMGGVTKKNAEEMEAGIGGAFRSLNSALESTVLAFGENFQNGVIGPIDSATDFFRTLKFSVNEGLFDPVFDGLEKFGDEIADNIYEIAENLPEALESVDWDGLLDSLEGVKESFGALFENIDFDDPESLADGIQRVIDTLESLMRLSSQIIDTFILIGQNIGGLIDTFNSLDKGTIETVGKMISIGAAIAGLAAPVMIVTQAITGLSGAITILTAHPLVLAFLGVSAAVYGIVKGVDYLTEKIVKFQHQSDEIKVPDGVEGYKDGLESIANSTDKIGEATEKMVAKTKEDFNKQIEQMENSGSTAQWAVDEMKKLGEIVVDPEIKLKGVDEAKQKFEDITVTLSDGSKRVFTIPVNTTKIDEAAKKIEEEIPAEKRIELETDIQIEKIKAQTAIAEKAFDVKAKIDIAEIEAGSRVMQAMAKGVADSFASTGSTITGLFSNLNDEDSLSKQNSILRAVAEEQERRNQVLEMQKELNQAQVEYLQAKKERLESGDVSIKVEGDGLAYHLEAMMDEIFSAIQIKASQEGLDQLLLGAI